MTKKKKKKKSKPKKESGTYFLLEYLVGEQLHKVPAKGANVASNVLFGESMYETDVRSIKPGETSLFEMELPSLDVLKPILIANNENYRGLTHRVYHLNDLGLLVPWQRILFFTGLEEKGFFEEAKHEDGLFDYKSLEDIATRNFLVGDDSGEDVPVDFAKKERLLARDIIYGMLEKYCKAEQLNLVNVSTVNNWLISKGEEDTTKNETVVSRNLRYYELFAEKIHPKFAEFLPGGNGETYLDHYKTLNSINMSLGRRTNKSDLLLQVFAHLKDQDEKKEDPSQSETSGDEFADATMGEKLIIPVDMIPYYATLMEFFDQDQKKFYVQGKLIRKKTITKEEYVERVREYAETRNPERPNVFLRSERSEKTPLEINIKYLSPGERSVHLDIINEILLSTMFKYLSERVIEDSVEPVVISSVVDVVVSKEITNNFFYRHYIETIDKREGPQRVSEILPYAESVYQDIQDNTIDRALELPSGSIKTLISVCKNLSDSMPTQYWKSQLGIMDLEAEWQKKVRIAEEEKKKDQAAIIQFPEKKLKKMRKQTAGEGFYGQEARDQEADIIEFEQMIKDAKGADIPLYDAKLIEMREVERYRVMLEWFNTELTTFTGAKNKAINYQEEVKKGTPLCRMFADAVSVTQRGKIDPYEVINNRAETIDYIKKKTGDSFLFYKKSEIMDFLRTYKLESLISVFHPNNFLEVVDQNGSR
ncbi:hypothetical protein ACFL0W_00720 [Nanoarchaeota archaeon]